MNSGALTINTTINMPIKISFILPCFNVAPYIGRCFESISKQDLPQEEVEIICVDDCSTDNTVDVVLDFQKRMPNILLYQHNVNKTSGGARNTGIDKARGEYIWFVDPDDSIEENVAGYLYQTARDRECDSLLFNFNVLIEGVLSSPQFVAPNIDSVCSGEEYIRLYGGQLGLYSVNSVYRSIYRRSFVVKHNLRYPQIMASQDVVFVWRAIVEAQRMSSIDKVCYYYIRRANSMTGQVGKLKPGAVLSQSLLFSYELKKMNVEWKMVDSDIKSKIYQEIWNSLNTASRDVFLLSKDCRKEFYRCMLDNKRIIDEMRPNMNRKTKAVYQYHLPFFLWDSIVFAYNFCKKLARKI